MPPLGCLFRRIAGLCSRPGRGLGGRRRQTGRLPTADEAGGGVGREEAPRKGGAAGKVRRGPGGGVRLGLGRAAGGGARRRGRARRGWSAASSGGRAAGPAWQRGGAAAPSARSRAPDRRPLLGAARARARGRGTGDSGGGVRGGAGPDAPPLGSARRSPARSPRPAAARPGPRSAVEEPPEEPGARARRPPDMVGHLHLQGMEESLKEKSREGLLDSPDSGLPPSPSPSPPFYSLAPGILDARAGGSGASSEAPGPGEAKAVSTRLRAETGNRASPPDGVLQEPGLGSPPIPPAKKVAK